MLDEKWRLKKGRQGTREQQGTTAVQSAQYGHKGPKLWEGPSRQEQGCLVGPLEGWAVKTEKQPGR